MKAIRFQWRYIWISLGVVALVMLVRDFNSRMAELHRLTLERDRVGAKVTSMMATYQILNTEVALATSDLLVEERAREDLKYSKEGDHPIILMDDPNVSENEPIPQTVPAIRPVERWELWLALFVDTPLGEPVSDSP